MARLLRPHIPIPVRCRVVLRQIGEMWPEEVLRAHPNKGALLATRLALLAELLHCAVTDLHLDHNPALGARDKVFRKGEHVGYKPDANDPEYLLYREAGAHRIKTNIRGDGAQHPDRVLIKRQRRYENGVRARPKRKWPSRPLKSANRWPKGPKMRSR